MTHLLYTFYFPCAFVVSQESRCGLRRMYKDWALLQVLFLLVCAISVTADVQGKDSVFNLRYRAEFFSRAEMVLPISYTV